jgi:hypothetical protein
MEQLSIDENVVMVNNETIEISMNDEIMEENVSVQTKTSKNPKNEREKDMKINLKKLHAQRKSWQSHGRLSCVGVFIVSMII